MAGDNLFIARGYGVVLVSFDQDYRSDIYHDRGTKTLHLAKRGGTWKITREMWRP